MPGFERWMDREREVHLQPKVDQLDKREDGERPESTHSGSGRQPKMDILCNMANRAKWTDETVGKHSCIWELRDHR